MSEKTDYVNKLMTEDVKETSVKAEPEISKSKLKRENQRKAAKKAKTSKILEEIAWTAVFVVLGGLLVAMITMGIYRNATRVVLPTEVDFSYGLSEDGMISGADLSAVKDIGLMNLSIPAAEVVPTDEAIEEKINTELENNQVVDTDASREVADGDKISLDYVGTVDGVAFDGGSTDGVGTDLTIGSGSYVDDFEEQLIGAHPGDDVKVEVTFPEDYDNAELAGKDAVFAVTVNGIYTVPEFTDEFVKENLSEYATTAEEYRQYVYDTEYDANLDSYIKTYVSDNASASKFPAGYLKHTKELLFYIDNQSYSYMSYIYSMYGMPNTTDFYGYMGTSENGYQNDLRARGKKEAASLMAYNKVFVDAGLAVTEDDYNAIVEENGAEAEETYGKPYLMQQAIKKVVTAYIKEHASVQ